MADEWPSWLTGDIVELEREIRKDKLHRVASILRNEIESERLIDTGRLYRSIRVDEEAGTVTMKTPYAEFVEEGRAPGGSMPPYKVIRAWVGRKLGLGGGKGGRKSAHSVAWAIMTKIHKRGIPGKHVLARAWRAALEE